MSDVRRWQTERSQGIVEIWGMPEVHRLSRGEVHEDRVLAGGDATSIS